MPGVDSPWRVVVIDFNTGRYLYKGDVAKTKYGTLGYSAPEVLSGIQQTFSADDYSVGKIIRDLVTGKSSREADRYVDTIPVIYQMLV